MPAASPSIRCDFCARQATVLLRYRSRLVRHDIHCCGHPLCEEFAGIALQRLDQLTPPAELSERTIERVTLEA